MASVNSIALKTIKNVDMVLILSKSKNKFCNCKFEILLTIIRIEPYFD